MYKNKNLTLFFFGMMVCLQVKSQTTFSLEEIQGDWSCYDTRCQVVCEDCCSEEIYLDLRIKGDSVSFFHYPDMYYGTFKILLDKRGLYCDSSLAMMLGKSYSEIKSYTRSDGKGVYSFAPTSLKNDTLVSSDYYFFTRTEFKDSLIILLRNDSINPSYLSGKWNLVTTYDTYYDGNGIQPINFPFKLPSKLSFERNPPKRMNKVIYIKANGILRDFYIDYLSPYRLSITAGAWNEEGFEVTYEKAE